MKARTHRRIGLGALLAWVALAAWLSAANSCSSGTAPRIPTPPDTGVKDTIKTGLRMLPGPLFLS